jgi:hypothetical protein
MQSKHKITRHKFYNKWDYKISLWGKGLSYLRHLPAANVPHNHGLKSVIEDLSDLLMALDPSDYAKRIETNILDIYVNDRNLYDRIIEKFSSYIRLTSAPGEGMTLDSGKTVQAKKLPYDRYHYKVFLKPHRMESKEEKRRYLDWLETQTPRVNITDNVKKWFYDTNWNWDRRYMYVEDDATLLILKMKNPEALGTVYSYEVIDK